MCIKKTIFCNLKNKVSFFSLFSTEISHSVHKKSNDEWKKMCRTGMWVYVRMYYDNW